MKALSAPGSIWQGSRVHSTTERPVWSPGADPTLRRIIEEGHRIIVVGRNSSDNTMNARLAARDALEAANEVLLTHGMDARHCLPSVDDLVAALRASPNLLRSKQLDGSSFGNRFVLVEVAHCGLVLSISCGSARKLTAELDQPHVEWLRSLLKDPALDARGFVAKNFHRLTRDDDAIFPLVKFVKAMAESQDMFVADGTLGRWTYSEGQAFQMLASGQGGRREAEENIAKRIRGYVGGTDTLMVNGRIRYAAGGAPPPGTFRYRDMATHASMLAIDEAGRPEVARTHDETMGEGATPPESGSSAYAADGHGEAKSSPDVRDAHGASVYQAENVMWALTQFGGRLTTREVMTEMLHRRYSTDVLRNQRGQGDTAYFGSPSRGAKDWTIHTLKGLASTILDNLEFYRTGRLVVNVGNGHAPIVIENVFPACGRWASDADFARIDAWRLNWKPLREPSQWSWTGLAIDVNGEPAHLHPAGRTEYSDGSEVRWCIKPEDTDRLRAAVPGRVPPIPDDDLTAAILSGVVAANGLPLREFVVRHDVASREQLDERDQLKERIKSLAQVADVIKVQVTETDPKTGRPLVTGQLLSDLNDKCNNALNKVKILEVRLAELDADLQTGVMGPEGVSLRELEVMLNGLTNPKTGRYRDVLKHAVRNLRLNVSTAKSAMGVQGCLNTITGSLVVSTSAGPRHIPFEGQFNTGALRGLDQRVDQAERAMRTGRIVKFAAPGTDEWLVVREVIHRLNFDPSRFALRSCYDSTLLRIGMAVVAPPDAELGLPTIDDILRDSDLQQRFGNVQGLVDRIRATYVTHERTVWLTTDQSAELVQRLVACAQNSSRQWAGPTRMGPDAELWGSRRWRAEDAGHVVLGKCLRCGSRTCSPMRQPEVTGYLCLEPDCRTDEAGVRWGTDYDRYVCSPQLWVTAGVHLDIPAGYTGRAHELDDMTERPDSTHLRLKKPLRKAADFHEEERAAIVAEYRDGTDPGTEIARRWHTPYAEVLRLVEMAGVPRRSSMFRSGRSS
jgi:hypothetical protein